mgnify:FL=1
MPGLTNRRRAIQEGQDWTKSSKSKKVKGYMGGGRVTTPITPIIYDTNTNDPAVKRKLKAIALMNSLDKSDYHKAIAEYKKKPSKKPSKRGVKRRRP